jgi:hypothetical protein
MQTMHPQILETRSGHPQASNCLATAFLLINSYRLGTDRGSEQGLRLIRTFRWHANCLVQLLGAHLEEADPKIYEILQRVLNLHTQSGYLLNETPGKTSAEAFHQSHSL